MPLTVFYGLMTLAPLVFGLALIALGYARRAAPAFGVTLAAIGVALPILGLSWLAAEVSAGYPLEIAFWGGATTWLAIYARGDALAIYAGLGIAVIVAPLLIWVAWRAAPPDSSVANIAEPTDETNDAETEAPITASESPALMGRWQWLGVGLALALETAFLSLVFAENILWLTLTWLIVIGLAWALGELGSDTKTLDWKGLAFMAVPPIIWLVPTLMIATSQKAQRLLDLTGTNKFPLWHTLVMLLGIALAAGAWPALGWVRKRASITAPAGLGAAILAVIPAALIVGARTFSIAQTGSSQWPALTVGKPPITVGAALVLLGAVTCLFAGLLALGRRDGRAMLASSALVFASWGLVALGVGSAISSLGLILLLTTGTLGLGAMLAALVGSGAITADIEPDSAGPRIFGVRPSGPALFAWIVGAASAVGLPLFAGFMPQQIITAAALPGARVVIPLVGLAWGGSALLLLGLLRATAPAFSTTAADAPMRVAAIEPADVESEDDTEAAEPKSESTSAPELPELKLADLPATALGVLALIAGIAPSALLLIGSIPAASAFLQQGALDGATQAQFGGYSVTSAQWYATPIALTVIVVALVLALIRWRLPRLATAPQPFLSGQMELMDENADSEGSAEELTGLSEPADAWDDLSGLQTAGWVTPGGDWLGGMSEESLTLDAPAADESTEAEETEESDESEELDEADEADAAAESAGATEVEPTPAAAESAEAAAAETTPAAAPAPYTPEANDAADAADNDAAGAADDEVDKAEEPAPAVTANGAQNPRPQTNQSNRSNQSGQQGGSRRKNGSKRGKR